MKPLAEEYMAPGDQLFVFSSHLKAFLICREILHCMKLAPVERILGMPYSRKT